MQGSCMTVSVSTDLQKQFTSFLIAALLSLTSILTIVYVEEVEASVTGDLSIMQSTPTQDNFIPAYVATYLEVNVTNNDNSASDLRNLDWYVCLGIKVANSCISNSIDTGEIEINILLGGENGSFTSDDPFYPLGLNETLTVVYQFDQFDSNPSDDVFVFQVNASLEFTDIRIDVDENLLDNIPNIHVTDGIKMINNNTNYTIPFTGYANLCALCEINATVGWQLWNHNYSEMLEESYEERTQFPKLSFYREFTMDLPIFSYDQDGVFNLIYGIFNSTGNPHADMFENNNLNSLELLVNSDFDIRVSSLKPAHNPSSPTYLFGENMVSVSIINEGNNTATNFTLDLIIENNLNDFQSCHIAKLVPNQQISCIFDMPNQGSSIQIEAIIPTIFDNIPDLYPDDNVLSETSEVLVPQLSSLLVIDNQKEWYTDEELIVATLQLNPFAAGPVNTSWWYSGLVNIGYGQSLTINTSDYGLGGHNFKSIATDIFGNMETTYFNILIYREINADNLPYYEASAITPSSSVEIEHSSLLPEPFESYNLGNGKTPLLLIDMDLIDTNTNQTSFDGQNWIDVMFYLDELLPDNVAENSVEVRKLDSALDKDWEYFNPDNFDLDNNNELFVRVFESTTILLIGTLDEPNIEARNFTTSLISNGNLHLSWDLVGEMDSDYNLGWNIYQKLVPSFGGTVFPSIYGEFDELLWNDLTANNLRQFITLEQTSWTDLQEIPEGFCASYAIVPVDRKGDAYFSLANVSMDSTGNGTFICGDSTPPATSMINFDHTWEFTNDSDCFDLLKDWSMCYEITLSWTWPAGENNETWNLYRIEQNPNGIDLSLVEPILQDLTYNTGDSYTFIQSGLQDNNIRPLKTFYYILTPIDEFGNERTVAIYPSDNVERVHIEDDWWAYNQHLIPEPEPEPEPPLGNDWLGDFSDNMEQQEFKIAGLVTLVILCLGVIMLALISKRLKRLRKVISARKRRQAADSMANEFDDFFE